MKNYILEKSQEIFRREGYSSLSLEEIRAELDIPMEELNRFYSSKEELFLDLMGDILDEYFQSVLNRINYVEGSINKIDFLLTLRLGETEKYSLIFLKDILENPVLYKKVSEKKKEYGLEIFNRIIKEGIENKEIRDLDIEFTSNLLSALIDGIGINEVKNIRTREDIIRFSENFYDFIKYGLVGS